MRGEKMSGRLSGKTVVIIVANEFEDIELLYPILRLSEEAASIVVVPMRLDYHTHTRPYLRDKPVTGRFGHTVPIGVMAEGKRYVIKEFEEISADTLDCLLFPGGYSPDGLRIHKGLLDLIRECHKKGKIVAAICHGPWLLISAGILKGKKVVSYAPVKDDLVNAGAQFLDVPAVRDGNIITGRVPDDLPEFCQEIMKALS
jgi:protease I